MPQQDAIVQYAFSQQILSNKYLLIFVQRRYNGGEKECGTKKERPRYVVFIYHVWKLR